jgi:hypothetical protein
MEFATTRIPCTDCGLALEDPPGMLAPSTSDEDQIAYDLVEWPAEDRVIATDDLVELDIPYRWEDGLVLVVPAAVEDQVDALLDEIDENAESEEDALLDVGDGEDGGEEATTAMGDLFVAADALHHARYDEEKVVEFIEAAAAVGSCLAPFGVEPQVWRRIQTEASAIVAALEKGSDDGDDDESITEAAGALRELLRHYV